VGVLAAGACSGPEPPPFKPVVDTKLLMQATIDPTADEIWEAVRTIVTKNRTEEIRPLGQPAHDGAACQGRRRMDGAVTGTD
jgi:hypothetical protein